ncbi:unnamed protein product [Microthlaspi erraticum]|uniref:Uncharacterized protein n=1 Tax=Microthlaspi erraticum TaxID=1685480 RepID=A0A6D2IA02_9BRAS|nr:unnamed protein product [Microthlaspi erraticum]
MKISLHPLDETVWLDGADVEDLSEFITDDIGYRNTEVLWDVVRFPIPPCANLKAVGTRIRLALGELGLHGCDRITAYGGSINRSKEDFNKAGMVHEPQGKMVVDLVLYARTSGAPRNLMVIPGPDPDSEMHRVLKCLQARHHGVLLVNPEAPDGLFLSDSVSVKSVVACTQALDGGKPIIRGTRMEDTTPVINGYFSLDSLFSQFLGNSSLRSSCHGSVRNAFVFWDLVKYPIPTRVYVPSVARDIRAALQGLGNHGCVEILAFGGDKLNQRQGVLYNEARIIYIPQGVCEMAEALKYFQDSGVPGTLMVIPRPDPDSEMHRVLKCLQSRHDDLLFVKPPDDGFFYLAHSIVGCTEGLYGGKPLIRGRRRMEDAHVIQDFSSKLISLPKLFVSAIVN